MKKNIFKKVQVYYIIILLVFTLFFGFSNTPVIATDTVLENFDGEIVGTETFSGDYFNITYIDDGESFIHEVSSDSYYSDPYSYKTYNPTTSDKILMNVSWKADWEELGDLWDFSIMVKWSASTCYATYSYLVFYNHTNDEQIKIVLQDGVSCPTQDPSKVYNVDNNGDNDLVVGGLDVAEWYRIRIRMLSSNVMEQSVYNANGTLLGAISTSGWRHINSYSNWTYMQVVVEGANGGAYGDPHGLVYIDDIFLSTTTGDTSIDLDNLFEKCSYGGISYKSFSDYYLESYTKPIGDITVYAVDLYVNRDQYMYVDLGNKNKYDAYINGIYLGTPDYYFQESGDMYILRWLCNRSLSESTGMTLEFGQVDMAYSPSEIHWLNLPCNDGTGQEGGTHHSSSSKYGDGSQYGVPFDTNNPNLGLKYCIYYLLNDAESTNTYDISLMSVDPHAQGNISQFFVDVTGDNDWWGVIVSPNATSRSPYEVYFELHENGEDAISTFNIPVDASIGEWKFYAIDKNLYDYPVAGLDDYGTNITFNVSDGSAFWGDFAVRPAEIQVQTGDMNGFYALAPDGVQFAVRIVKPDHTLYEFGVDTNTYVGVGDSPNWIFSGRQISCEQDGTWIINIYNASGLDPTEILTGGYCGVHEETAYFDVSDTLGSSINIFPSDSVCVGSTVRFQGMNAGLLDVITISFEDEHEWSIPVDNGLFDKAFTVDYVGEYEITFKEFSLTITVNDCGGGTGGGGTGGEWYGLPYWVPYLIGVFITLFITFSPLIIASYISRKTKWKKVEIPALLYVGFFFMGMITSVLMGFLPIWLPFVILFSMVVYFAVQWLYGSRQATGEE